MACFALSRLMLVFFFLASHVAAGFLSLILPSATPTSSGVAVSTLATVTRLGTSFTHVARQNDEDPVPTAPATSHLGQIACPEGIGGDPWGCWETWCGGVGSNETSVCSKNSPFGVPCNCMLTSR